MFMKRPLLVSVLALILLAFVLAACDTGPASIPTANQQQQAAVPTATATLIPPTVTPTPLPPTATPLPIVNTTEWGTVKSTGAEVKAEPNTNSATVGKLQGFSLVSFQRKTTNESWWERTGGGWIARDGLVIYRTEAEASRSLPQTASTGPTPTYVPPAQVNINYGDSVVVSPPAGIAAKPPVQAPKGQTTPTPQPPPAAASGGSGTKTGAICNDGSASSATGSGACSHHGGVAYWTYK